MPFHDREYGLDGVLVQRFLTEVSQAGSPWAAQHNAVLDQVAASARARGRVFAAMWDASGAPDNGWADMVKNDWTNVVANHTSNPAYLHEGGKPVVALFGLGLANHQPTPSAADAVALITWLKQRAYVIGSGPYWWRQGGHDALPASAGYAAVHSAFDAVMPWSVGRWASAAGFKSTDLASADAAFCAGRGQDYAPIAFAGFSFHNSDSSKKLNSIPRMGGAFLQAQIDAYLAVGGDATFFYVAMFDEVNEGTAVYKAAATKADAPVNAEFVTLDSDGTPLPADHYLKMVGTFTAASHARGGGDEEEA